MPATGTTVDNVKGIAGYEANLTSLGLTTEKTRYANFTTTKLLNKSQMYWILFKQAVPKASIDTSNFYKIRYSGTDAYTKGSLYKNATNTASPGYGAISYDIFGTVYYNLQANKSVSTTPTLNTITPARAIATSNLTAAVNNYAGNTATIYYIWTINSSSISASNLLANKTNTSWFYCPSYTKCKVGSEIFVQARAVNSTAKSSYSTAKSTTIKMIFNATARNALTLAAINNITVTFNNGTTKASATSTVETNITQLGSINTSMNQYYGYSTKEKNITVTPYMTKLNETYDLLPANTLAIYNIYDERDGTTIKDTTITATLQNGYTTTTQTTTNGKMNLTAYAGMTYKLSFSASNYSTRVYYLTIPLTSSLMYSVYLLPTSLSGDFRFFTKALDDTFINNATVNVYKVINSTLVNIAATRTDLSGSSVIPLYTNNYYIMQYAATGYTSSSKNIQAAATPVSSCAQTGCYTEYLSPEGLVTTDAGAGVVYIFTVPNTTRTERFNLTFQIASVDPLSYYGITITFNGVNYLKNISNGTAFLTINLTNSSYPILATGFWKKVSSIKQTVTKSSQVTIINVATDKNNLKNASQQAAKSMNTSGKIIFAIICIVIILVFLSLEMGLSATTLGAVTAILLGTFTYMGYIPYYIGIALVGILILGYVFKSQSQEGF